MLKASGSMQHWAKTSASSTPTVGADRVGGEVGAVAVLQRQGRAASWGPAPHLSPKEQRVQVVGQRAAGQLHSRQALHCDRILLLTDLALALRLFKKRKGREGRVTLGEGRQESRVKLERTPNSSGQGSCEKKQRKAAAR